MEYIPVDKNGRIDPQDLQKILNHNVHSKQSAANATLVSIMYANNEVGTIQQIKELAQVCHIAGAIFHTDAVQAVGKIPIDVKESRD